MASRAEIAAAIAAIRDNDTGAVTPAIVREPLSLLLSSALLAEEGDQVNNRLRFTDGRFRATSGIETTYGAITRGLNLDGLAMLVQYGLTVGGRQVDATPLSGFFSLQWSNMVLTENDAGVASYGDYGRAWPDGAAAPYVWILAPAWTGWVPDFQLRVRTWRDSSSAGNVQGAPVRPVLADRFLLVDGVRYQAGYAQVNLAEPARTTRYPNTRRLYAAWSYVPRAEANPVVTVEGG